MSTLLPLPFLSAHIIQFFPTQALTLTLTPVFAALLTDLHFTQRPPDTNQGEQFIHFTHGDILVNLLRHNEKFDKYLYPLSATSFVSIN